MAKVTLRYWAAAKDAAGVAEEKVEAETLATLERMESDWVAGHHPVIRHAQTTEPPSK